MEFKHTLTATMMHIIARPRIHISLADMGYASLRSFGGVGFSLDCEPTVVEFEPYRAWSVNLVNRVNLTSSDVRLPNARGANYPQRVRSDLRGTRDVR